MFALVMERQDRGIVPTLGLSLWWLPGILLGGAMLLLSGCGESVDPPVPLAAPGAIPPADQRVGDPKLGYDILVNRGYVTCGLPYEAFLASRKEVGIKHRLPGRRGLNRELPYNLNLTTNPDGVELVVTNCLTCHGGVAPVVTPAGEVGEQLVIGLGDAFLDFTGDPIPDIEAMGLFVSDGAPAEAWARWADRIAIIAPYMRPATVGVNPAPNLTMMLMAHRDPETLEWHDTPLLDPPPKEALPVSVPPWWRMQKKHSTFYHGGGRGDHVPLMMLKSLVCTDDLEEARVIDEWFVHVRTYIASLDPPPYPFPIDGKLAEQGRAVFEQTCARCHGTYGSDWTYPNLLIGLDEVGTDRAYAEQAVAAERFIEWFNGSFYGRDAQARPAPGYVAPPLDGIWATAPYLHNGSVPSIAALLKSDERPTYWRHQLAAKEYDTDALGWRYETLDHGQDGEKDPQEARMIYDTTRHGYGNLGHTFGDALADSEREALIEYLKTL
jgi:mono/diheme cytochrome c family protein